MKSKYFLGMAFTLLTLSGTLFSEDKSDAFKPLSADVLKQIEASLNDQVKLIGFQTQVDMAKAMQELVKKMNGEKKEEKKKAFSAKVYEELKALVGDYAPKAFAFILLYFALREVPLVGPAVDLLAYGAKAMVRNVGSQDKSQFYCPSPMTLLQPTFWDKLVGGYWNYQPTCLAVSN